MYKQLSKFRKVRGIESTPGNILQNIAWETVELNNEIITGNELGVVCELVDHVIYAINILEALGHDAKSNVESINDFDSMLLDKASPSLSVSYILIALSNYNLERDIKALALIARIALKTIGSMGYHAERAVLEKCKCINSRKGAYNHESDKWEKDELQPKSEIYQPDYLSCKK